MFINFLYYYLSLLASSLLVAFDTYNYYTIKNSSAEILGHLPAVVHLYLWGFWKTPYKANLNDITAKQAR